MSNIDPQNPIDLIISPRKKDLGGFEVRRVPPYAKRCMGGAPMAGDRLMWWNFVASRQDIIDRAKQEWSGGVFDKVTSDEDEFIPLPEG
jgi:hypothetical protein